MDETKHSWQNIDYVYSLFSGQNKAARKIYRAFVEKGIAAGSRPNLSGGGLLRSSGGWFALKGFRKAGIRLKGDERILGDSDFVENVLKTAAESLQQKYELQAGGYDFERATKRVAEISGMALDNVMAANKSLGTVRAGALLCYWAHRKLGMSMVEIAGKLNLCQSAVSRLSMKGEKIGKEYGTLLLENKSKKA